MATARQMFVINKLSRKLGVKGRVASRYVEAGYSVRVDPPLEGVDFTASKKGVRLAGIIITGRKTVDADTIENAKKIGEEYRVKPVIILYGSGPSITPEALRKAREYGVSLRRIRI
jgi:hypothetical protein